MLVPIFGTKTGETTMARNTSVSLSDHFTSFIDEQIQSGKYASASDVVRAGLRLLERDEKYAKFQELISEGIADIEAGRVYEVNDGFWEDLNKEVDERLKRGDRPSPHVLP
jgi:antitoxin ParD1/3/4